MLLFFVYMLQDMYVEQNPNGVICGKIASTIEFFYTKSRTDDISFLAREFAKVVRGVGVLRMAFTGLWILLSERTSAVSATEGHVAQNFTHLRRIVLSLLKHEKTEKVGI